MDKIICPRCKGKNSDRCEQGGQACTDCDGTGKVDADYCAYCWGPCRGFHGDVT